MSLSSVFIPNVESSLSADFIAFHFKKQELGIVKRVDLVLKMDRRGVPYNAAYVHMERWFDNVASFHFQERIENGKEARIPYNDPKYWTILKNTAQKPVIKNGRKVRIDLTGLDEQSPVPTFNWVEEDYIIKLRNTLKSLEAEKNYKYLNKDVEVDEDALPVDMPYLVREDGYGKFVNSQLAAELEQQIIALRCEMDLLQLIEMDEYAEGIEREEEYRRGRREIVNAINGYY